MSNVYCTVARHNFLFLGINFYPVAAFMATSMGDRKTGRNDFDNLKLLSSKISFSINSPVIAKRLSKFSGMYNFFGMYNFSTKSTCCLLFATVEMSRRKTGKLILSAGQVLKATIKQWAYN